MFGPNWREMYHSASSSRDDAWEEVGRARQQIEDKDRIIAEKDATINALRESLRALIDGLEPDQPAP